MPQSMTTAPGLIHDPRTSSGCPIATTKISAVLVYKQGPLLHACLRDIYDDVSLGFDLICGMYLLFKRLR